MKLSKHNTFLPSTQRATQWAAASLALLKSSHPLMEPSALFKAFQSSSLVMLIEQLKAENEPPVALIEALDGLMTQVGSAEAEPIELMIALRNLYFTLDDQARARAMDRWFYRSSHHSVSAIQLLEPLIRVEQSAHVNGQSYFLAQDGELWVRDQQGFQPVRDFENIVVRHLHSCEDALYVLDSDGIVWVYSGLSCRRIGQYPQAQRLLATVNGPIVRMNDHVLFQAHRFPISSKHPIASDGEIVLFNATGVSGYRLDDGRALTMLPKPQNKDEELMMAAIHDMATSQAGLELLMYLQFWTLRLPQIYRLLQHVGDVLYVSPDGSRVLSLNEDSLLFWSIQEASLKLVSEHEIADAWSVSGICPIHSEYKSVLLQTTSGVMAVDLEDDIQVRLLVQPAFAIRVFPIGENQRFAMSTGQGVTIYRFERQKDSHESF